MPIFTFSLHTLRHQHILLQRHDPDDRHYHYSDMYPDRMIIPGVFIVCHITDKTAFLSGLTTVLLVKTDLNILSTYFKNHTFFLSYFLYFFI